MTAEPWPLPRLHKWTKEVRGSRTYLSVGRSVVLRGRLGGRLDSGERTRPGLGVRRERLVL